MDRGRRLLTLIVVGVCLLLISALLGLAHLEVVEKNIPGAVAMLEEVQHWMQARPGSHAALRSSSACQLAFPYRCIGTQRLFLMLEERRTLALALSV